MKATAKAYPIQGLIKYHGMKDEVLRLPYHDSISVCCGPISTITTVEADPILESDIIQVDGQQLIGRPLQRAIHLLSKVRKLASKTIYFRAVSRNSFPSNIGLGASSSGFAALAYAACSSLALELDPQKISTIARLGAGSATRSVTGGFSIWKTGTGDENSFAYRLDKNLKMEMLAVVIPNFKQTEDAHKSVTSSPFFEARLRYISKPLKEMEAAIDAGDIDTIGRLAEMDTMNLHGITMTSSDELLLWKPDTLRVIQIVKEMRAQGHNAYFSIDTGATVYINTFPEVVDKVKERFEEEGFDVIQLEVAPPVQNIADHLF